MSNLLHLHMWGHRMAALRVQASALRGTALLCHSLPRAHPAPARAHIRYEDIAERMVVTFACFECDQARTDRVTSWPCRQAFVPRDSTIPSIPNDWCVFASLERHLISEAHHGGACSLLVTLREDIRPNLREAWRPGVGEVLRPKASSSPEQRLPRHSSGLLCCCSRHSSVSGWYVRKCMQVGDSIPSLYEAQQA